MTVNVLVGDCRETLKTLEAGSVQTPESVTDRPTKAHEYVFLLSKSERYYYDAKAIAEPSLTEDMRRPYGSLGARTLDGRTEWHGGEMRQPRRRANGIGADEQEAMGGQPNCGVGETRNKRTVWTIASEPCAEAHFAVMPSALVVPCILAGSRIGDTVLDPFGGSGTTARVAEELGRNAVLCELNPEYAKIIGARTAQPGLFAKA